MGVVNASPHDFGQRMMDCMADKTTPETGITRSIVDVMPGQSHIEPLAYSETVELPDPRRSHVPVALFVAALLALTAAAAGWFLLRPAPATSHSKARSTSSSTPSTPNSPGIAAPAPPIVDSAPIQTEVPPAPAAAAPTPVDHDAVYIDDLVRSNIGIADRNAAIAIGHEVCSNMTAGYSWKTEVSAAMAGRPSALNWMQAQSLVDAAIGNYCPQYMGRIGG